MNKKRLIINSVIAIVLVSILLMGNTYSIFTSGETEEDTNVYTTGNLNITYTLSSDQIALTTKTPINDKDNYLIEPYRITIHNNGTVPYQFNLRLTDTTASDTINYEYIMARVGKLDSIKLSRTRDKILKEGIIVNAQESIDIDVRVWLSNNVKNSEIGKAFYAKLSIDGIAIYSDTGGYDNSTLTYPLSNNLLSKYIEKNYKDGTIIDTPLDESSKIKLKLNTTKNIMLDNNDSYRYYGKNPNNYVKINNELWRIVSLEKVYYDEKDITGTNRVKLIKEIPLETNQIENLDTIYEELKLNKETEELLDTTIYYLGKTKSNKIYDIYANERNNNSTQLTSKAGLIYLSDYLYANDYGKDGYTKEDNWIYKNTGISTITYKDENQYIINKEGNITTEQLSYVYPTIYLKSDIIIKNGDGTRNNPFTLTNSINE